MNFVNLLFFDLIRLVSYFTIVFPIHEFAHALTAYLLGDPTAKKEGRLTLNPFSHLDRTGILSVFILGMGWSKPAPFNPHNFKFPRLFSIIVALAGPFANIALGVLFYSLTMLIKQEQILSFFRYLGTYNIFYALLNVIPLSPLDGSTVVRALIPASLDNYYMKLQRDSVILLIFLFIIIIFFSRPLTI